MNEHEPIGIGDAIDLDRFFSHAGESSVSGMNFDRAALLNLLPEFTRNKAGEKLHLKRRFAQPREPVYGPPDAQGRRPTIGTRVALTARYGTGANKGGKDPEKVVGPEEDFDRVESHAITTRRLRRMMENGDTNLVVVLQVYFGPIGNNYAVGYMSEEGRGRSQPVSALPRVFSLVHVVPAGQRLLESAQSLLAPSMQGLSEYARMRVHCTDRGLQMYRQHRDLFAQAEREAEELFHHAAEAWNAAARGERAERYRSPVRTLQDEEKRARVLGR